jgi:hypothetical protein
VLPSLDEKQRRLILGGELGYAPVRVAAQLQFKPTTPLGSIQSVVEQEETLMRLEENVRDRSAQRWVELAPAVCFPSVRTNQHEAPGFEASRAAR